MNKQWEEMTKEERQEQIKEDLRREQEINEELRREQIKEDLLREQAFEELAAFGEGTRIIDVVTGETWIAGKRPRKNKGGR